MFRSRRAMLNISRVARSGETGVSAPARIASTEMFNCSIRSRSAISATYPRPQALQAAELQLFHGSLGFAELTGDFLDALLLDESHFDDTSLIAGQFAHELEHSRLIL